jgi:hypothetical protein
MRRMLLTALAALSVTMSAGAQPPTQGFFIYLWNEPKIPDLEVRAKALADAGFTVVDWSPDHLDVLPRYGLRAMVHDATPELATKLAGNQIVWGYHVKDEPYPESEFVTVGSQVKGLRAADSRHLPFVNMLSTTGEFLRTYMKVVQPELLSFDYYQWWWGSNRYFEKLEQFREAAVLAGVPLASCFEVSANPAIERGDSTYVSDNARKLRQSVYTTLAYGSHGVEWFNAAQMFEGDQAVLTPAGKDVAALNAELKRIGPVLATLGTVDVFHTPPLAAGTRTAPIEYWVQLTGEEGRPGLVQGMLQDASGLDYMLVANRDYREQQNVTVRLQSKWLGIAPWNKPKTYHYQVEIFDKKTTRWIAVTSSSAVGFSFVIAPADGELFRITTRVD